MIVLNRKRLMAILGMVCVALLAFSFKIADTNQTVQTVALPVSNKVIVIDAGHGIPDEGAQSSSRNNRSTNQFENSTKITELIRAKWFNRYFNT